MRRAILELIPQRIRRVVRPVARLLRLAPAAGAWDEIAGRIETHPHGAESSDLHTCNICNWTGNEFIGGFHSELARCPRCGSIARDRFLLLSFLSRTPYRKNLRLLETSPRLGEAYRRTMRSSFDYTASDFDLSAHEGDIRIDLQDIALPSDSVDVLLTPHVLEHVPDTERALREILRILTPGGRMCLQVPLCRGVTAVPSEPEFHADNTPVFFNFGWDITRLIERVGFDVRVLVTEGFFRTLSDRARMPISIGDGFDLESMWKAVTIEDLTVVADERMSHRLGLLPDHHFVTWECTKPT